MANVEQLPRILFGTSSLGNLFSEPTHDEKKAVVEQILASMPVPVFDSAGKYGAGHVRRDQTLESTAVALSALRRRCRQAGTRRAGRLS